MSRRRYLSTDISTDSKVNRLRLEAGEFAALLYTWMIPHASDKATIEADPEELLAIVCPLMRDKTPGDAAAALLVMDEIGLIWWNEEERIIAFPESFEDYQNYLKAGRRRTPEELENHRKSSSFHDNPRTSTKNSASFSFSSSLKSSFKQQQAAVAHTSEKPPPSLYADILNGSLPKLESMFQGIDQLFTPAWLAKELADAAAVIGPLSREQLGRGLDIAVKQIERQMAAKTVRNPRPFARKLIVDYLTEQRDEHHAA